jgi:hypothetical protein
MDEDEQAEILLLLDTIRAEAKEQFSSLTERLNCLDLDLASVAQSLWARVETYEAERLQKQ